MTEIGTGAFGDCYNLETIEYYGTEEEWATISKPTVGTNGWDYNCGRDTESGMYEIIYKDKIE